MGLQAESPFSPTFASTSDDDESQAHPEKLTLLWNLSSSLFFQAYKPFFGLFVSRFVPFALERMLGTVKRKPLLMQKSAYLVVAETNTRDLGQMLGQTRR